MEKKTVRVRIWSGKAFYDYYTTNVSPADWAENKMMELQKTNPKIIYDRYEILPDDRA